MRLRVLRGRGKARTTRSRKKDRKQGKRKRKLEKSMDGGEEVGERDKRK